MRLFILLLLVLSLMTFVAEGSGQEGGSGNEGGHHRGSHPDCPGNY